MNAGSGNESKEAEVMSQEPGGSGEEGEEPVGGWKGLWGTRDSGALGYQPICPPAPLSYPHPSLPHIIKLSDEFNTTQIN